MLYIQKIWKISPCTVFPLGLLYGRWLISLYLFLLTSCIKGQNSTTEHFPTKPICVLRMVTIVTATPAQLALNQHRLRLCFTCENRTTKIRIKLNMESGESSTCLMGHATICSPEKKKKKNGWWQNNHCIVTTEMKTFSTQKREGMWLFQGHSWVELAGCTSCVALPVHAPLTWNEWGAYNYCLGCDQPDLNDLFAVHYTLPYLLVALIYLVCCPVMDWWPVQDVSPPFTIWLLR